MVAPKGRGLAKAAKPSSKRDKPIAARTQGIRRSRLEAPVRPETPADVYTSRPVDISFAGEGHRFTRADLEITAIDHGEASYEGRIFFDNADATADTALSDTSGYAGSFFVFGHGGCVGDAGHCEINGSRREANDLRFPHPLTPASKYVDVTSALREIAKTRTRVRVTIVPVVSAANSLCDTKNVFQCGGLRIVSYDP